MELRHTLAFVVVSVVVAVGCGQSHSAGESDAGPLPTPVPDGGPGVCCPIDPGFSGCSPGLPGRPAGGFAASADECASHTISGYDGRPFARDVDPYGCPVLREIDGCCGCVDAGPPPPPIDAGDPPFPTECDGLGPAACLAAGCAPDFDDACCPACDPTGGCADCTNVTYHSCQPYAAACLGGPSCGTTPPWGCGPVAPDCSAAQPTDADSCDVVGCVPAYPSGTVADPSVANCVPILATSCTVLCRRLPPPCPEGTTAEGDGSCYTDRCIPSFVCD